MSASPVEFVASRFIPIKKPKKSYVLNKESEPSANQNEDRRCEFAFRSLGKSVRHQFNP